MLEVKLLNTDAKLPTVGHAGSDLGYDLYANCQVTIHPGQRTLIATGISATFRLTDSNRVFGLLIKDRSSIASKGIRTSAGVIDAGYTGEINVLLTNNGSLSYSVEYGEKIAQMLPTEVFTAESIIEVSELEVSSRGSGGFGSTGS